MKIRFENFWHGFRPDSSLVGDWCTAAFGAYSLVDDRAEPVDLEIVSVKSFPTRARRAVGLASSFVSSERRRGYRQAVDYGVPMSRRRPARRRVWYTGENIRPAPGFDLTLSFDLDDFENTNVYAPLFLDRLAVASAPSSTRRAIPQSVAGSPRRVTGTPPKFCAAVISNPHPVRLRAIEALRRVGGVDVFGHAFGRPVGDKLTILRDYRFCLSFENDLYPGYVTEKLVDAWAAQCVPLWWGLDAAGYINRESIVNLADYATLHEFVQAVAAVEADPALWRDLVQRPLLSRPFAEESIVEALRRLG